MRRLGLLLLLFIAGIGAFCAWLDHEVSQNYKHYSGSSIFVDIPHGTSRWRVAEILHKNGVIHNALAFELLSRWHSKRSLQAGEYLFDEPMNERQVFWKIADGHIYVHTVQITEGWTMFEIADALEREGLANREDFPENSARSHAHSGPRSRRQEPRRISVPFDLRIHAPRHRSGNRRQNGSPISHSYGRT